MSRKKWHGRGGSGGGGGGGGGEVGSDVTGTRHGIIITWDVWCA